MNKSTGATKTRSGTILVSYASLCKDRLARGKSGGSRMEWLQNDSGSPERTQKAWFQFPPV